VSARLLRRRDMAEVRIEQGSKRVRAYAGGELVFDTTRPLLVWEKPFYPAYYVPAADLKLELVANGRTRDSSTRGTAELFDIKVGAELKQDAGWRYPDSPIERLRDVVRFEWNAMDEWLEEDEPIYVHPRSPYVRVDILASSRHVKVELDGVTIAESSKPTILFETHLPARFYLPISDVRMDLLEPSDTQTACPYKGTASYWSVDTGTTRHEDVGWTYRSPLPESQKIAGLVSFYNERVDLYVDGALQRRPGTKFS
jgi:uncharacterized protein (DUF427 family)